MNQGMLYYRQDADYDAKEEDIIKCFSGKGALALIAIRRYMTRNAGFYCKATDAPQALKRFPEISQELYRKVIKRAVRIGIYDAGMYNRFNILTSLEIQKNYFDVAMGRINLDYDAQYALFDPKEYTVYKEDAEKQKKEWNHAAEQNAADEEYIRAELAAKKGRIRAEAEENAAYIKEKEKRAREEAKAILAEAKAQIDIPAYRKETWIDTLEAGGFNAAGDLIIYAQSETQKEVVLQNYLEPLNAALHNIRPGIKAVIIMPREAPAANSARSDDSTHNITEQIKKQIGYCENSRLYGGTMDNTMDNFMLLYARACTEPTPRTYDGLPCTNKTFISLLPKITVDDVISLMRQLDAPGVRDRYHYLCGAIVKAKR